MRILLAEDEKIFLKILKEEFEEIGIKVIPTSNGLEALRELKANSKNIDLVVLDIMMPVVDGFQVLEEMKKDQLYGLNTIPVVVLSNLGQDEEIKRAFKLGAVDYFVKSQHPISEVIEKVKHILEAPKMGTYNKYSSSENRGESYDDISRKTNDYRTHEVLKEDEEVVVRPQKRMVSKKHEIVEEDSAEEEQIQKPRKLKVISED